jgi:hypothetical protein
MSARGAPALLIDTTSLLRADLDSFETVERLDDSRIDVIDAFVLHDHVFLDGPSVDRNQSRLSWLIDVDQDIEILPLRRDEVAALYDRASSVARRIQSSPANALFLYRHIPRELGWEIGAGFAPSTDWGDLRREARDLRTIREAFEEGFGEDVPQSATAFVALARLFYYLALQESLRCSLLLDPLKGSDLR